MIGLFQENGPCHFVNGEDTPSLNKYSWNNYANMLYIDQPIGVGFSYGTNDVTSTETAAPYVWKLLQAFYAQFPEYESRDFGIFTEVGPVSDLAIAEIADLPVLRWTLWPRIRVVYSGAKRRHQSRNGIWRKYQPGRTGSQQRLDRLGHPRKGVYRVQLQQHLQTAYQLVRSHASAERLQQPMSASDPEMRQDRHQRRLQKCRQRLLLQY